VPPTIPLVCGHEGCDMPVLSSLGGATWFHWVDDQTKRPYRGWSPGPVQRQCEEGGLHDAQPPAGLDIAAHVAAIRASEEERRTAGRIARLSRSRT
jgi:hypothetical protein